MTAIVIAISGILLQLLVLFGRPVSHFVGSKEKGCRAFLLALISLRLIWAMFAYWTIWFEWHHLEELDLDLPGIALVAYAAIFPVLILAFDWLIIKAIGISLALFCLLFGADASR